MEFDLSEYKLKTYKGLRRDQYFDEIREKYVLLNPEEIVRQKFVLFLIDKVKIPKANIRIEQHLKHHQEGNTKRADIVVFFDKKYLEVLLVVECKAPNIPVFTDNVEGQLLEYNQVFKANFLMITNGEDLKVSHYIKSEKQYKLLKKIPLFTDMLNTENIIYNVEEEAVFERPVFAIKTPKTIIDNFIEKEIIGENSNELIKNFGVNLGGLIFDRRFSFEEILIDSLGVLVDKGLRNAQLGNASGNIGAEQFRRLVFNDLDSNPHFFNLAIQPRFSTKGYFTYLVLAVDYTHKTHNTLQLCLDKYSIIKNGRITIWHDGHMSFGSGGSFKKNFVIAEAKKLYPELIKIFVGKEMIFLGDLNFEKQFVWEDLNIQEFLINLTKYIIVREGLRNSRSLKEKVQ